MDFLSLDPKLFYRAQLTRKSLWNKIWRSIVNELPVSSNLQLNQHNPIFRRRYRIRQQMSRCSLFNPMWGMWTKINWTYEAKREHSIERIPQGHFAYKYF